MKKKREMEQGSTIDLNVLPEACISNTLSLTSPLDVCRLSVVSSFFRSAADSDSVWERFLPSDIQQILSSSSSSVSPSLPTFSSKKELFLYLCDNPLLVDNGTKTFALEKCSGKKRYMIASKDLSIVVWKNPPLNECNSWSFKIGNTVLIGDIVRQLKPWEQIRLLAYWLKIHGKLETRLLSPNTTYGAYLVLDFTDIPNVFDLAPTEVSVKLGSDCRAEREEANHRWRQECQGQVPKERGDEWMEIEMGEFFNERGEDEVEISLGFRCGYDSCADIWAVGYRTVKDPYVMSLMVEVRNIIQWKSGLIIKGIELRPKENQ